MPSFTEMVPAQLPRQSAPPDVPVAVDVRLAQDAAAGPPLVPGARRASHNAVSADDFACRFVVVVCHDWLTLSGGVAALQRVIEVQAKPLDGGHTAWPGSALQLISMHALPLATNVAASWAPRNKRKNDAIASPWLIRRSIDPAVKLLFVPPHDVTSVAERYRVPPFDASDVTVKHQRAGCTFGAFWDACNLHGPELDKIAETIRAADTDRNDLVPQAPGLVAMSVGLSRLSRDNTAKLEAGMVFHDARLRLARDGQDETHGWPEGRA